MSEPIAVDLLDDTFLIVNVPTTGSDAPLRPIQQALLRQNERIAQLERALAALEALLVEIDGISWKRDGMGVCDSEDNSGDYYQSHLLAGTLKRIRAGQTT